MRWQFADRLSTFQTVPKSIPMRTLNELIDDLTEIRDANPERGYWAVLAFEKKFLIMSKIESVIVVDEAVTPRIELIISDHEAK